MAATRDCHVARLVFPSTSDLIADSALPAGGEFAVIEWRRMLNSVLFSRRNLKLARSASLAPDWSVLRPAIGLLGSSAPAGSNLDLGE